MISLTMDMVQYDCPYIAVTDDVDVSFYTMHWDFDAARRTLETRILVSGDGRESLTTGLDVLREQGGIRGFDLLSREGDRAVIKSSIDQTNAMRVIRDHHGYITGPFRISEGSELWNVGFDTDAAADEALSALERENEFTVETRDATTLEDHLDLVRNVDTATDLLDGCRSLSAVERRTLRHAVDEGYFETPRGATLGCLADEFDVSKTAASKNLRRSERKVLERVVEVMDSLDGERSDERAAVEEDA